MSDGNFNTQLLSHGGFASGVRAGEARMKQRATAAFFDVLINDCGFCEDDTGLTIFIQYLLVSRNEYRGETFKDGIPWNRRSKQQETATGLSAKSGGDSR